MSEATTQPDSRFSGNDHFDGVAKILAAENLTIIRGQFRTAAIDLEKRVMMLPEWSTLDSDLAEMFRGHELSHALHTPLEGWHDTIKNSSHPSAFQQCLNICEDGRIESMLMKKFPGYRAIFERGYKKLWEREFFGTTDIDKVANEYLFHDRLNVLLKLGASYKNKLIQSREELLIYIDVIDATTWEDIVAVSEKLFAMIKNEQPKTLPEQPEFGDQESDDPTNQGSADADESESDSESGDQGGDDQSEGDKSDEKSEDDADGEKGEGDDSDSDGESEDGEGEGSDEESESGSGEESEDTGGDDGESADGDSVEGEDGEPTDSDQHGDIDDNEDFLGSKTQQSLEDSMDQLLDDTLEDEKNAPREGNYYERENQTRVPMFLPKDTKIEYVASTTDILEDLRAVFDKKSAIVYSK